ncbi:unnamed protein product [Bathycoccus prasinos]
MKGSSSASSSGSRSSSSSRGNVMMMIRMMIRDGLEGVKKYIEETTNNKEDSKTSIRNAALVFACTYLLQMYVFSTTRAMRNPTAFPQRRYFLETLVYFIFAFPLATLQAAWVLFWIIFWQLCGKPLWKPTFPHRFKKNTTYVNEKKRRDKTENGDDHAHVSLCGGGFRTWYHLGVYFGLRDNFGETGVDDIVFAGASIGALVAALAGANVKPEEIWKQIPPIAHEFREPMGFIHNLTNIGQYCRYLLNALLPEDAHKKCNGRVFLSVTKLFPTPHNVIISEWHSREDLINCVLACGYIPGWTWPGFCVWDGNICVDGGVTNNLPSLHENALRVGLDEDDIKHWNAVLCPSQALPRVNTFIPADDEHLTAMVEEGKDDFEDWLDTPAGVEFALRLHGRKRHKRYSIEIDPNVEGFHR